MRFLEYYERFLQHRYAVARSGFEFNSTPYKDALLAQKLASEGSETAD